MWHVGVMPLRDFLKTLKMTFFFLSVFLLILWKQEQIKKNNLIIKK